MSQLGQQLSSQSRQLSQLNGQLTSLRQENEALHAKLGEGRAATTPGFEALAVAAAVAGVALLARRRA